ncbi:MAG: 30S ribosomal protein S2 [Ardenticatenales bacterium]|nr:30S ribosomal protein S2 [Ardenticatenales bacterium]MCB9172154.1 30S ribosomal protein S2 [Ardenticatenales bacterium]
MKSLLEAGVHFGHRTRRWNPKMRPFIFTERNGIHIIDLSQTLDQLHRAYEMVRKITEEGGVVLFVGTKRQAQDTIEREAERANMPYVSQRWLGGTLTNFRTIRQRVRYLQDQEAKRNRGEFELITKKEALDAEREIEKLNLRLGGIKNMETLPDALFVIDVRREHLAIHEATILGIPVIGVVDTNCDPDGIDLVVPSNDDAIRAIRLMAGAIADAAVEGGQMRAAAFVEEEEEAHSSVDTSRRVFSPDDDYEDDRYRSYSDDEDDDYEDDDYEQEDVEIDEEELDRDEDEGEDA